MVRRSKSVFDYSDHKEVHAAMNDSGLRKSLCRFDVFAHGFGIMAAVMLTIGTLLWVRDAGGPRHVLSVASAEIQPSMTDSVKYSSKPIRDIQPIADRVLADNPETPGQAASEFGEFDRESWRIVRLEVPKPDGAKVRWGHTTFRQTRVDGQVRRRVWVA